jgi:cytochrome c-type biogenesis protein CcmH
LSCVPLLALLVYGAYGSPDNPDQPLSARLQDDPSKQDFALSFARIEAHLAAAPTDAKGWAIVAPIYLREGRYDDAARAFAAAVRYGQPDTETLAGLGEARIMAAGGVVTEEARASLAEAVKLDPKNARARYFLALAKEQDGDGKGAMTALRDLLADAAPDARWAQGVHRRLEQMEADAGRNAIAALAPADQQAAIRAMVDSLAERLKADGGTLAEWTRLIRSQTVLGDKAAARETVAMARERLSQDGPALTALDVLAGELALKETAP